MGNAQSDWKQSTSTTVESPEHVEVILENMDGSNPKPVSLTASTRRSIVTQTSTNSSPPQVKIPQLLDLDRAVLANISSFFNEKDHAIVGSTCKALRRITKKFIQVSANGRYYHGYGPVQDRPERYLLVNKPIVGAVVSIQMNCLWKDQGWGPAKGRLFVRLLRPPAVAAEAKVIDPDDPDAYLNAPVIATEKSPTNAPRRNEKLDWKLIQASSEVCKLAKPGDRIEVQREIGGQGCQLWIEDFKITILMKLD
jgi:hypothetical protein